MSERSTKASNPIEGFNKFLFTLTSFHGAEREKVKELIISTGAQYTGQMTRRHTHLVCPASSVNSEKFQKAFEWGIHVVNKQYVIDVLKHRRHLDEKPYLVKPGQKQHSPAPPKKEDKKRPRRDRAPKQVQTLDQNTTTNNNEDEDEEDDDSYRAELDNDEDDEDFEFDGDEDNDTNTKSAKLRAIEETVQKVTAAISTRRDQKKTTTTMSSSSSTEQKTTTRGSKIRPIIEITRKLQEREKEIRLVSLSCLRSSEPIPTEDKKGEVLLLKRSEIAKKGEDKIMKKIEEYFSLADVWFEIVRDDKKKGAMVTIDLFRPGATYLVQGERRAKPEDVVSKTRTGLVYDKRMLLHSSHKSHPEMPQRLQEAWSEVERLGLQHHCKIIPAREATFEELKLVHSRKHIEAVSYASEHVSEDGWDTSDSEAERSQSLSQEGNIPILKKTSDIYINKFTATAARLAVGCVIDMVKEVVEGRLDNGVAIVRPPGHHAERDRAMGFCLFNNVAVAAEYARTYLGVKRVLIVDPDVHHGNGTQHIFEDDPDILYFSIHQHDDGQFYPGTGKITEVGIGKGAGATVNIPWPPIARGEAGFGDADYLAAFHHVLMPIATEFAPELVIVSAGFDAVEGDILGSMRVSPSGFTHMVALLKTLARGRIVLALEGGYNVDLTARCLAECIQTLLYDRVPMLQQPGLPSASALRTIKQVMCVHAKYWQCMRTIVEAFGGGGGGVGGNSDTDGGDDEDEDNDAAYGGANDGKHSNGVNGPSLASLSIGGGTEEEEEEELNH